MRVEHRFQETACGQTVLTMVADKAWQAAVLLLCGLLLPLASGNALGSSKKGLGMWSHPGSQSADVGATWYYNWSPWPKNSGSSEFVPMIWGPGRDQTDDKVFNDIKNSSATNLLGFNEPDHADQSNMTIDQVLAFWPKFMATGKRLGSPAPASSAWLDEFMRKVDSLGYRVDFIAVHTYPDLSNCDRAVGDMESWLRDLYEKFHKPIWLTEFGACSYSGYRFTQNQVDCYIAKVVPLLERLEYVERYAWFFEGSYDSCPLTGIWDSKGNMTATGWDYKKAR